jgi:hypothetical protein
VTDDMDRFAERSLQQDADEKLEELRGAANGLRYQLKSVRAIAKRVKSIDLAGFDSFPEYDPAGYLYFEDLALAMEKALEIIDKELEDFLNSGAGQAALQREKEEKDPGEDSKNVPS